MLLKKYIKMSLILSLILLMIFTCFISVKLHNVKKEAEDLNLELSIANDKIKNMQNEGIPVYFTKEEVDYISKTVYGEARGYSKIQQWQGLLHSLWVLHW